MGSLVRTTAQPRASAQEPAAAQGRQYLTFIVTGEMFAIPIASIKEIIEYRPPTDVPMMPAFIRGVINLRGRAVPVVDLSARFGRGAGRTTRRTCIVIVEIRHRGERHDMGLAVDAVSAVLDIADADIEPPPTFAATVRSDFISGMGKVAEQFVIILDIDQVLTGDELSSLRELKVETEGPAPSSTAPGHDTTTRERAVS
jgi:purine-binding chemotaxis protein CheW